MDSEYYKNIDDTTNIYTYIHINTDPLATSGEGGAILRAWGFAKVASLLRVHPMEHHALNHAPVD